MWKKVWRPSNATYVGHVLLRRLLQPLLEVASYPIRKILMSYSDSCTDAFSASAFNKVPSDIYTLTNLPLKQHVMKFLISASPAAV